MFSYLFSFLFSFLYWFLFEYLLVVLACLITSCIVMSIIKFKLPFLISLKVAFIASLGIIIPNWGWIIVPLIALLILKRHINYEWKGIAVVFVIWLIIWIPAMIGVIYLQNKVINRLIFKTMFPPGAYEELNRKVQELRNQQGR